MGHSAYAAPYDPLRTARRVGIPHTKMASRNVVTRPRAAEITPLLRSPPIMIKTTASGNVAIKAEVLSPWNGASGCGHTNAGVGEVISGEGFARSKLAYRAIPRFVKVNEFASMGN